ncbi:MAG: xanthine dehydrogenase family protein subunit M [Alphaproteobacteria bacterium]|nr:MAG: xanthine dehydrogenase family protein subunit M [Alphaproteobacteria bacterium]
MVAASLACGRLLYIHQPLCINRKKSCAVMRGLVRRIHVLLKVKDVDGRAIPGSSPGTAMTIEARKMKPAPFRYHAPTTIEEAVDTLAEVAPEDGRILAGGQSLVPIMAFRLARPAHLVDINGVKALSRLAVEDGKLCIGACVRHVAFEKPVVEGPLGRLLADVVRHIAHYPIRTRGTFCGSVAHADPASEWCLVVAALDGEMVARSTAGTRIIPARDFFRGIMSTALKEDELLIEVRLPIVPEDTRCGFYEFNRRAGDFALAMALATFRMRDGAMIEPRLALGSVEDKPRRIAQAEELLAGRPPERAVFEAAAAAVEAAVDPLDDLIVGAEYRRDLSRTIARRALERATSS